MARSKAGKKSAAVCWYQTCDEESANATRAVRKGQPPDDPDPASPHANRRRASGPAYFEFGLRPADSRPFGLALAAPGPRSPQTQARVIVQGQGRRPARAAGPRGRRPRDTRLPIVDAVGATVPRHRIDELTAQPAVTRLFEDRRVEASGKRGKGGKGGGGGSTDPVNPTYYPSLVGADRLHAEGVTGNGVTVAVLDSGFWGHDDISRSADRKWRQLDHYDAIRDRVHAAGDPKGKNTDDCGHAAHVLSVLLSSGESQDGVYHGVAPNADVLPVKVLGRDGSGSYADVIRGIGFVVANKDYYGVRVMNLSLSAPAQSRYWDDPLNQAVMQAWQAGIVVVASAGNTGPGAQTIGVPGNVPYVITVGAMTDNYTPGEGSDDFLATFSSTGPTREGFLKPKCWPPAATCWVSCTRTTRSPRSTRSTTTAATGSSCPAARSRRRWSAGSPH